MTTQEDVAVIRRFIDHHGYVDSDRAGEARIPYSDEDSLALAALDRLAAAPERVERERDELREALERVRENARSWHGPDLDTGQAKALVVIADWCGDALVEDGYGYLVVEASDALGSNPASVPLDPKFPYHVEGCVCPRFNDIAPALIADLTCPVHGVKGTDPGDRLGVPDPAREPKGE